MKPYLLLSLAALLSLGGAVQAQSPYPGYGAGPYGPSYGPSYGPYRSSPRMKAGAEASAVLREGMDKMLGFLAQEETPNKLQMAAFLDRQIAPYFDFRHMAKWVAGPGYARMSEEKRAELAARLEASFLDTLAKQLVGYEDQQVRFFRPRTTRRDAVSVKVGILRPGGYPSKLEFRMYRSDDGWKVYDVVANGRSASAYYRMQRKRASTRNQPMPPRY